MSVGSLYAKIRRGPGPDHTGYAFQRSTTPPGSSSSNSPTRGAGAASSLGTGASHSTNAGSRVPDGFAANRPLHFTNVLRASFDRRQNADTDSPLAS
jgi:hypothetical protein